MRKLGIVAVLAIAVFATVHDAGALNNGPPVGPVAGLLQMLARFGLLTQSPNLYGAACNGVTDDSAAFQAAIDAGQRYGQPVRFLGQCLIKTQLNITERLEFYGTGIFNNANLSFSDTGKSSRLIAGTNGMTMIQVTTDKPVYLHDFSLADPVATGITGLWVTGDNSSGLNMNAGSTFRNIGYEGMDYCFYTTNAGTYVIDGNWFVGCGISSATIQNVGHPDAGDSTITNSVFSGAASYHILYLSSGGLRVENNKINAQSNTTGIYLHLQDGAVTGDLFIIGNSIEGVGWSVFFARQGTGSFQVINITGNELSSGGVAGNCVGNSTDSSWLSRVNINGNICVGAATGGNVAFLFQSAVNGLIILNNTLSMGGSANQPFSLIGQTSTNCIVGAFAKVTGSYVGSGASSCTVYNPI